MSNFLQHLVTRFSTAEPTFRPRMPSLFEPVGISRTSPEHIEDVVAVESKKRSNGEFTPAADINSPSPILRENRANTLRDSNTTAPSVPSVEPTIEAIPETTDLGSVSAELIGHKAADSTSLAAEVEPTSNSDSPRPRSSDPLAEEARPPAPERLTEEARMHSASSHVNALLQPPGSVGNEAHHAVVEPVFQQLPAAPPSAVSAGETSSVAANSDQLPRRETDPAPEESSLARPTHDRPSHETGPFNVPRDTPLPEPAATEPLISAPHEAEPLQTGRPLVASEVNLIDAQSTSAVESTPVSLSQSLPLTVPEVRSFRVEPDADPQPVALPAINVSIGRIDVTATSVPKTPPRRRPQSSVMSLSDYLRRTAAGGGG